MLPHIVYDNTVWYRNLRIDKLVAAFMQVCVSSVDPSAFLAAVQAGATMVSLHYYPCKISADLLFLLFASEQSE